MGDPQAALGYGPLRDGHGRALDTLVRDRGTVPAELFRALGALKALQVELHGRPGGDGAMVGPPSPPIRWPPAAQRSSPQRNEPEKRRHHNGLVWSGVSGAEGRAVRGRRGRGPGRAAAG
jgi:hypothetical protein